MGRGGGWCEGECAVGVAGDFFAAFVDADVVAAPADQAGVLEGGFAAVGPVVDVVDLTDPVVGAAADAAPVAGDQLFVEPFGDLALGATQDWAVGVLVEDPRQDLGITGDGEGFDFGEASPVGQATIADLSAHHVVVGQHDQLCSRRRTSAGAVAGVGADELRERVGEALRRRRPVLGVLGSEQLVGLGYQGGADPVSGEGVELGE